ncbi:putative pentatricopeptide repeat-containing protein [Hibiscus syriacus]|uniref:Pentatricopeptide repeat-containing protein n=1 Tax=Hibiscus syriacus TaxID=106335 RepID=A0A6A2YQC2_HIBSY|nr:putative pentatricopeptide repeat-containing protein [Hibiscus syriacus]
MQEHIRQIDQGKLSLTGYTGPSVADGMQPYTRGSQKVIEAVMQSAANGKVQTIRQGYLSKRSSNLRGDWKRRAAESWLSNHYHSGANDEKSVTRHTVNLLTSTIKAENALDQRDWIENITGVITSLLSSQTPETSLSAFPVRSGDMPKSLQHQEYYEKSEKPIDILRKVPGNDKCADCGAPEPDWASLNLGLLICIECSGVHHNLGVRSLKLDIKVWESSVLYLLQSLGNFYVNSIWEELYSGHTKTVIPVGSSESEGQKQLPKTKPSYDDPISAKELFIHAKYAEKAFVCKLTDNLRLLSVAEEVWESVRSNDLKSLYRHIVCNGADVNTIYGHASYFDSRDQSRSSNLLNEREDQIEKEHFYGCSLLHLACLNTDIGMVELLLQYGANVNASDSRGRVPLHLCIVGRKFAIAKLLISRGADPQTVDGEGKTPLQLALASGVDDNEVLSLFNRS